ncbi:hypothetical protein BJV82DRAFT_243689 [Fennellomyces sp. T-0311]|nr:hypothetical protein BJV82DRAFT_243689 [Fennellomyces sp. T-0311]
MTIADALLVCSNLKELAYKTNTWLSDALGDLSILQLSNPALNSLQLQARSGNGIGADIEPLLQKCQQLRRLVLDGCTNAVLDVIGKHCPTLELLGYNTDDEVRDLNQDTGPSQPSGLRALSSTSGLDAIPMGELMPLLKNNMKTLDTIYVDICPENDPLDGTPYADLKFPNLKALKYWSDDNGGSIERILLQSIPSCTALTHFEALNTTIVCQVVDTLLTLPPVRTLTLADTDESAAAHTNLVRLFQKYSVFSHTTPCLDTVCFRYCSSVDDSVLDALGQVQTLRNITLSGLDNVTAIGLNRFLAKLGTEVLSLALASMDSVTDSHLITLGTMKGLSEIHLENLPHISNYGVIYMVDNANQLRGVLIKRCKWVTQQAVNHISWKVDVEFDEAPTLS